MKIFLTEYVLEFHYSINSAEHTFLIGTFQIKIDFLDESYIQSMNSRLARVIEVDLETDKINYFIPEGDSRDNIGHNQKVVTTVLS